MPRESEEFIDHEYKEITFYILIGLIMTVLLPLTLGLVFKGFEESFVGGQPLEFGSFLVTYLIYYIFIFTAIIGLPTLKFREMILTERGENIAKQSKPSPFAVAYLHDPEIDGALYNFFSFLGFRGKKNPMRFSLSMFRMFIIATLIFVPIGIIQIFTDTQATGIPTIAFQQITPAMEVLFTAEPPAFSETGLMLLVFSLQMGIVAYLVSKFKLPPAVFWVVGFLLICPLTGLEWTGIHNLVYQNSDVALFNTFIFGWVGSTLTLLFGTFILWYVWHFWNNIFAKLNEIVPANEDVIFISLVLWVILLIAYIGTEILIARFKKKYGYIPAEPIFKN